MHNLLYTLFRRLSVASGAGHLHLNSCLDIVLPHPLVRQLSSQRLVEHIAAFLSRRFGGHLPAFPTVLWRVPMQRPACRENLRNS
jgi:hypothetical protein